MNINRETFEAWLFSQPDDRSFAYSACTSCLICHFVKEMTNFKSIAANATEVKTSKFGEFGAHPIAQPDYEVTRLEPWLANLLLITASVDGLTIGNVKSRYVKLFGNPTEIKQDIKDLDTKLYVSV